MSSGRLVKLRLTSESDTGSLSKNARSRGGAFVSGTRSKMFCDAFPSLSELLGQVLVLSEHPQEKLRILRTACPAHVDVVDSI